MNRDPTKVKQTREEKKRKKQEEKAEAKRLAKEQKDNEFNLKHDRDQVHLCAAAFVFVGFLSRFGLLTFGGDVVGWRVDQSTGNRG